MKLKKVKIAPNRSENEKETVSGGCPIYLLPW
jgi:hypothetical protein